MDDIVGGQQSPQQQYESLGDEFSSRIEWAKLRLSFKKLRLYTKKIKVLGVTHTIGGELLGGPHCPRGIHVQQHNTCGTRRNAVLHGYGLQPNATPHTEFSTAREFRSRQSYCRRKATLVKEAQDEAMDRLLHSQNLMQRHAKNNPKEYNIGDMVFLNGKNIKTKRLNKKLDHKFLGPFRIRSIPGKRPRNNQTMDSKFFRSYRVEPNNPGELFYILIASALVAGI
ncbi:hypothetical protein AJ79_06382 [Helicocarpus griseus UAMH5409]|uniref:Uncharacterized protein n=1 Tax=Helicocarpus griseus UAMH5409 TaxID=1447875 RepID=A0A2B7XEC9_9EURO|nr:hypothetical protein AJ79_06382 [Helicocarpus griseus UAMH5409]